MIKMEECFGIVLMIDALGVSQYKNEECRQFIENQKELKENLIPLNQKLGSKPWTKHFKSSHLFTFGDTIILCLPIDRNKKSDRYSIICQVAIYAINILKWGLEKGILFRGCISVGEYIFDENTVLGPAIFDAHDWYESTNWFGIILSPKSQLWVESIVEEKKRRSKKKFDKDIEKILVYYNVPLAHCPSTQNTKEFLTVAWPWGYFSDDEKTEETPREVLLNELFKIPESKEGEPKFKNGIDFFDWYDKKTLFVES